MTQIQIRIGNFVISRSDVNLWHCSLDNSSHLMTTQQLQQLGECIKVVLDHHRRDA